MLAILDKASEVEWLRLWHWLALQDAPENLLAVLNEASEVEWLRLALQDAPENLLAVLDETSEVEWFRLGFALLVTLDRRMVGAICTRKIAGKPNIEWTSRSRRQAIAARRHAIAELEWFRLGFALLVTLDHRMVGAICTRKIAGKPIDWSRQAIAARRHAIAELDPRDRGGFDTRGDGPRGQESYCQSSCVLCREMHDGYGMEEETG